MYAVLVLSFLQATAWSAEASEVRTAMAPLLAQRCVSCHGGSEPKGGLDLSTRALALKGGDNGSAVNVTQPLESPLWQRVAANEMPPKHPLSQAEKELLQRWLMSGAVWVDEPIDPLRYTSDERAGYDWWSLQPIVRPTPPLVADVSHPIDAFVRAKLAVMGLIASPEAERAVLIRRLSYDLLGLPPTPEEIAAFLSDRSPDAYEQLVDRLLASPHYGERWARHWLDVVRYGESNGYERDLPRPTAWHYRDWVVDAINRDLPYDQFVRWQLAGDTLDDEGVQAAKALGFLVAGPHDTVVPVVERMRQIMRQDEMEDLVGTVGQTFLGLTINCARCHDHKFDPISSREYYQFTAALAGVNHGERDVVPATVSAQIAAAEERIRQQREQLQAIEDPARQAVLQRKTNASTAASTKTPPPLAAWDFTRGVRDLVGALHGEWVGEPRTNPDGIVVDGTTFVQTAPLARDLTVKTLEVRVRLTDLDQRGGGAISVQSLDGSTFDAIVFGEQEPRKWMAGSNGFVRTLSFRGPLEDRASTEFVTFATVYQQDGTIAGYRNGQPYGQPFKRSEAAAFPAGQAHVLFGLRHRPPGGNHMLKGTIAAARLYDRALTPEEVAASALSAGVFVSEAELLDELGDVDRRRRSSLLEELSRTQKDLATLMKSGPIKIYTDTPNLLPGPVHVLRRGNVADTGEAVTTAGLSALKSLSADLQVEMDAPDRLRRSRLADWITDRRNSLFSRVMANRLWHYHFGLGLVETPNDFGFHGGRPSHPELLDWLAAEFLDANLSIKRLHRLMVTSETYRQSSQFRPEAATKDAHNRFLWRMAPRRLDAETIRDAMLAVTGTLQTDVGGKGYSDVNSYFFKGTQFYDPIDPTDASGHRRTIYRGWARGGRSPFLDTFDCPDPSTPTPKRSVTTTPLQALSLLNNAFVLRMADRLAGRLTEASDDPATQVVQVYQLMYSRQPRPDETAACAAFAAQHGWPALCRALLNSSEFLYVD